jgi:shikimate dehydrogenase
MAGQAFAPAGDPRFRLRARLGGDYVISRSSLQWPGLLRELAQRRHVGGNVTVPHKAAFAAVADMEPAARAIGAVNTLWLEARLLGTNTDGLGSSPI